MKKISYLIIITLIISSCSQIYTNVEKQGDLVAITNSGDTQTTYIKSHGDLDRYCASRQSDAVVTSSHGFNVGLSTNGMSENIGENAVAGAVSLGGRDPVVLLTREILYRACELSMNLNLDKNETIKIYKDFLKITAEIAENDLNDGSSSSSISVSSNSTNDDDDDDDDDDDE